MFRSTVCRVRLLFLDSTRGTILLTKVNADASGGFTSQVTIPSGATAGEQGIKAKGFASGEIAKRDFTVV
jgi:hypothetical protein